MRRTPIALAATFIALWVATAPAEAQSVHVTPLVGAFHPSSNILDLRDAAQDGRIAADNAVALGLNLDASFLRGSLVYASGARITNGGIGGSHKIGDGSMLAATGAVVLRPIPRLVILQPYILGGAGVKRIGYSFDDDGIGDALPDDATDFTWQIGLGADAMIGGFGLVIEASDFITRDPGEMFGRHDAFVMLGLRFRVF